MSPPGRVGRLTEFSATLPSRRPATHDRPLDCQSRRSLVGASPRSGATPTNLCTIPSGIADDVMKRPFPTGGICGRSGRCRPPSCCHSFPIGAHRFTPARVGRRLRGHRAGHSCYVQQRRPFVDDVTHQSRSATAVTCDGTGTRYPPCGVGPSSSVRSRRACDGGGHGGLQLERFPHLPRVTP